MFNNIRHYINVAKTTDKLGRLATPEEIKVNLSNYIDRMKNYSFVEDSYGRTHEISGDELNVLKNINNKKESDLPGLATKLKLPLEKVKEIIEKLKSSKYIFWSDKGSNYLLEPTVIKSYKERKQ